MERKSSALNHFHFSSMFSDMFVTGGGTCLKLDLHIKFSLV